MLAAAIRSTSDSVQQVRPLPALNGWLNSSVGASSFEPSRTTPTKLEVSPLSRSAVKKKPIDITRLLGSMKGKVTILGDIFDRDAES